MATVEVQGVEGMQALLGQTIGPSEWRTVTQEDIDAFARALRRRPVDPRRRRAGQEREPVRDDDRPRQPDPLAGRRLPQGPDLLDRLRPRRQLRLEQDPLPGPGPGRRAGSAASAEVVSVDEVGGGWWQVVTRFTLEVEGNEKPCFVGDSVTRVDGARRVAGAARLPALFDGQRAFHARLAVAGDRAVEGVFAGFRLPIVAVVAAGDQFGLAELLTARVFDRDVVGEGLRVGEFDRDLPAFAFASFWT